MAYSKKEVIEMEMDDTLLSKNLLNKFNRSSRFRSQVFFPYTLEIYKAS